jgi:hypothetical protein
MQRQYMMDDFLFQTYSHVILERTKEEEKNTFIISSILTYVIFLLVFVLIKSAQAPEQISE